MELLIIEDMHDVAIPIWALRDSSTLQCGSFVRISRLNEYLGASSYRMFEKQERANQRNGQDLFQFSIHTNSYSEEVVVGHVPKNMSKIIFMFLSLPVGTLK